MNKNNCNFSKYLPLCSSEEEKKDLGPVHTECVFTVNKGVVHF